MGLAPSSAKSAEHQPVLLREVHDQLKVAATGDAPVFVDLTYGRGGHARALLAALPATAKLIATDRDPQAIAAAQTHAASEPRLHARRAAFADLADIVAELRADGTLSGAPGPFADAVLMDLGISSPQVDEGERGFSFRRDGPLDMRMDPDSGESAAQWLNRAAERDIADVLKRFGEERRAKRVAQAIVAARPLNTTFELAELVKATLGEPRGPGPYKHPATRTFQAVRMQVNDELGQLERGLEAAFASLRSGGRLAVISFHSLEDRFVKQCFKGWTQPPPAPRRLPLRADQQLTQARHIAGPIKAGAAELADNPRARSAVLRVVERC